MLDYMRAVAITNDETSGILRIMQQFQNHWGNSANREALNGIRIRIQWQSICNESFERLT